MWSRQGDLYNLIQQKKKDNGKIPEATCPDIDKIIDSLEELRKDNGTLRDLGIFWYEYCEEISEEADKIIKDLEKEIEELESKNKDLESKNEDLKEELKNNLS